MNEQDHTTRYTKFKNNIKESIHEKLGTGRRHNDNKTRYDLLEHYAQEQKAKIFTQGAKKYEAHNWLNGMAWSKCLASAKRHQAAYEAGKDYDIDPNCAECKKGLEGTEWVCTNHTGQLHAALAAWNWDAITSYYKYFPQGDDRIHNIVAKPKIGLDIDEVLTKWIDAYKKFYGHPANLEFNSWWIHFDIKGQCERDLGPEFYLKLKPKELAEELPFDPHCYVTSRNIPTEITEQWLYENGFPCRPVYTVGLNDSKAETIKNAGCNMFIDDVYKNYEELTAAGICCFLYDAPHNQRYDVGYKRIKNLQDFKNRFL